MKRFRRRPNTSNGHHNNHNHNRRPGGSYGSSDQFDRKTRNNAQNAHTRHMDLARDALSSGDETRAENHFQHADHYQRVMNACDRVLGERQPRPSYDDEQPRSHAAMGNNDQPMESPPTFDEDPIEDSM